MIHITEQSGFPPGVLGAGADSFSLPSWPRHTSLMGYLIHWPRSVAPPHFPHYRPVVFTVRLCHSTEFASGGTPPRFFKIHFS
jgi:hypothetical protein